MYIICKAITPAIASQLLILTGLAGTSKMTETLRKAEKRYELSSPELNNGSDDDNADTRA